MICRTPECIGWTLGEGDVFCSWCGTRLLDLGLVLQHKRDARWEPLAPPVLNFDQRPDLQLVIRNTGQTGPVPLSPAQLECTAAWIGFDVERLKGVALAAGDSVALPVTRFKVPDSDSHHEALITVKQAGSAEPLGSLTLEVVPRPRFDLDLPVTRIQLESGANVLDFGLRLERGRATLASLPQFLGGWATVEWGENVTPPVDMDSSGTTRIPMRLRLRNESSETFAATSNDVILRRGTLQVRCVGREEVPIEVPVELEVTLAPTLYVEPFRDRRRLDWTLVRGLTDQRPMVLTLYNGFPGARGHAALEIRRLAIEGVPWLKGGDLASPIRLGSGKSATINLTVDTLAMSGREAVAQITFQTNAARATPYFLRVEVREPSAYPGWLVVDLGTTNSCAALLTEDRAVEMVPLDDAPLEKPTTMPSVVGYQRMVAALEYEVGGKVWSMSHLPDVAASVVIAAKRRIGTNKPFTVVPQKEPGETCPVLAQEVLTHLYAHVIRKATELLAGRGETAAVINRIIVAHPSRFTMRQIDELKGAVKGALGPPLRQFLGEAAEVQDLRTIHEPLGAALHFLNDWRQQAGLHGARGVDDLSYTLLVYDFGGGTIDITLLEIHSVRTLRPGMKPTNGTASVDLSQAVGQESLLLPALMAATLERCQSILQRDGAGLMVAAAGVNGADEGDVGRNNAFLLEQFARSVLRVLPAAALGNGDDAAWDPLRTNAHVNDRLALTAVAAGRKERREFHRQDILPSAVEVRRRLSQGVVVPSQETAETHPWSYTVTPHVVGATGHRWLGGEDVTAMMRDLLVERTLRVLKTAEKTDQVELPLDAETCLIQHAQAARNNTSLLRKWAEETKVLLSRGATPDELAARTPTLEVIVNGILRPVAASQLSALRVHPTLEELNRRLEPTLAITVDMATRLVSGRGPGVVLRVGKSSQLPLVARMLASAFPQALQVVPPDAKECVVQGACLQPLPGAGVTLSRGVVRAGVRLGMGSTEWLSATTSRLGIKVLDTGRAWFHELLPAGEPIPEEGLFRRMPGFGVMPGVNVIPVLENAGTRDELLFASGVRNPNIEELGRFEVTVMPDFESEDLSNVDLELGVSADMTLQLSVYVGDRRLGPYPMQPSSSGE